MDGSQGSQKHRAVLREAIVPEVKRRRARPKEGGEQQPFDGLTELIKTGRSGDEITGRFMAYIFAAMITTAGAMTNRLNDFAGRQEQWATLLEEQETVKRKHGSGSLTSAALNDMPKLHAFVWESIRCAALPMQQIRLATEDGLEFGSDGECLPKGAMVVISGVLANTLVDRHEEFLPERFLDDAGSCLISDPASIGFFPFGIGRHVCPGRHFALAETKGALATLLRTFRVETVSGVVPKYQVLPADVRRIPEAVRFTGISE